VHRGKRLVVVSDKFTREALGARVFRACKAAGMSASMSGIVRALRLKVSMSSWRKPGCRGIHRGGIRDHQRQREVWQLVHGREYSVFATSPDERLHDPDGIHSLPGIQEVGHVPLCQRRVFDLGVLARCPQRLVAAGFADVICRTTAPGRLADVTPPFRHALFDTAYALLAVDEDEMIASAQGLVEADFDALATLTRVSAIMGLGTSFTGTTHVGSMAEHMISHYIDMFSGSEHPGTSHGEQVGVATLTMSTLQNQILNVGEPSRLAPTVIPEAELREKFGEAAETMVEQTTKKALDAKDAAALNARLEREWDTIRERLRAVARPTDQIRAAMQTAGCQLTGRDLGLKPEFYRDAVRYSRFIRDRWTMLDVAGDSGKLEKFAASCD
jgi:glycerol-1-phosphate dehydrogenase [NAD(P)+]